MNEEERIVIVEGGGKGSKPILVQGEFGGNFLTAPGV